MVFSTKKICVEELFIWECMNTLVLCIATVKLLFFLRLFENYVMLVDLMGSVIASIAPFLLFLTIFLILISLMYRVAGITIDNTDNPYVGINSHFIYFIQIFRNAIGDEAVP